MSNLVTRKRARATPQADGVVLEVSGLTVEFVTQHGWNTVVDGVDLSVKAGRTHGLVGESGSGKSVTSLSIMGLIPSPPGRIASGSIRFQGQELVRASRDELDELRGDSMSMIFQEPMTSLNPAYTVGEQIAETVRRHRHVTRRQARDRAVEMLGLVGIPRPGSRAGDYPHSFSGGMRQRVMIAMALSCEPDLLIADEPTTALDVTIQAEVLELLKQLQKDMGMAVLFITHDLGVVADICDDVTVMYAGQVVESGPVDRLFMDPQHPYTAGLLAAMPQASLARNQQLVTIPGMVPPPHMFPSGCRFHPRCRFAQPGRCDIAPVPLEDLGGNSGVRCVRAHELSLEGSP